MVAHRLNPHKCRHCSRTFARTEHLVRHERTHTNEKPFECSICPQAFSRRDLLRRHERKHHAHALSLEFPHDGANIGLDSPQSPRDADQHALRTPLSDREMAPVSTNAILPAATALQSVFEGPETSMSMENYNWLSGELSWDMSALYDTAAFQDAGWLENFPTLIHGNSTANPDCSNGMPLLSTQAQPDSMLSRPGSPPACQSHQIGATSSLSSAASSNFSKESYERLQGEVAQVSGTALPPRVDLCRFVRSYFSSFHRHQPFLHQPTWSPLQSPPALVLALCANGALYDLEASVARQLFDTAFQLRFSNLSGLPLIQAYFLMIAFTAWSGSSIDIELATQLSATAVPELRRQWIECEPLKGDQHTDQATFFRKELLKRITYCFMTLFGLINVAYDIPSPIAAHPQYGLPVDERIWQLTDPGRSLAEANESDSNAAASVQMVLEGLSDEKSPVPSKIGGFACHIVVMVLLQRVISFQKAIVTQTPEHDSIRAGFVTTLRRWQVMWEMEPDATLSPDHPNGPILFNSTAILRVAYARLVLDFSDVRQRFTICETPEQILPAVIEMPLPSRSLHSTRAALQASLALRTPVRLGLKVVARTKFWIWSVQHSIAYFECAILLSKWLLAVSTATNLDKQESTVLTLVRELVGIPSHLDPMAGNQGLAMHVLRRWASLLDTEHTAVWKIIPKMGRVLGLYADSLAS